MIAYRVYLSDRFLDVETSGSEERAKELAAYYFRRTITADQLIAWPSDVPSDKGYDVRES